MMNWEDIARELAFTTDSKIVLLICDGLGGLPVGGRTELEAAKKPNLDEVARLGVCGVTDPVFMGITPGSGPAHLGLFGYDPLNYQLGRGILEALGSGVEVGRNDVVARGNFATLKAGLVVDRRAGRIPTSENERLCALLNTKLPKQEGVEVTLTPGKEHRFVARFRAEGLSDALSDADPQKDGKPRVQAAAIKPEAGRTAVAVNRFLDELTALLKNEPAANTALLRGFSKFPSIPHMADLYKLRPAAVANYPMYKGLAKLLGMGVLSVGAETADLFDALEREYANHDFFFVHYKKTDAAGEDGNFDKKVAAIEEVDRFIPRLLALKPDVLVVTSDHSTPALLHGHSWHPNPFVLVSPNAQPDDVAALTEAACARGALGRFRSIYA
ncbi:MAG TPA: 2,3-bisphosphoglycerate-independent phosphoglycerate mutase, partial [Acidobacteriota bacterium]|nr:2,3-bisphosphoglycerate-independent phosphoglycerate mutase [Acidobacteriota bacterium]